MLMEERFWAKVDRTDDCWLWTACRTTHGYGQFRPERSRGAQAHRVAWELTNGPIPAGMLVLHRCDNPPCVNPAHLFLGTQSDNMRDMYAKGRGRPRRPRPRRPNPNSNARVREL